MKRAVNILLAALAIASCSGNSAEKAREHLMREVEEGNRQMMQQDMQQATVCTGIDFLNDNIHYNFTINEQYMKFADFRKNREMLRDNITGTIKSTAEMRPMLESLEVLDGKMIYTYTGSLSNDTMLIVISTKELH